VWLKQLRNNWVSLIDSRTDPKSRTSSMAFVVKARG
jgi:hypothetical protein